MKKLIMVMLCVILCAVPVAALAEETMPMVTIDLTGVIVAAVVLVFDLILGRVVKTYLPSLKAWLDERTTSEQQKRIYDLIEKLVMAAEQIIGAGMGSAKMEYVVRELKARGIKVERELIEAAVKQMNDKTLTAFEQVLNAETTQEIELGEGVEVQQDENGTMRILRAETMGEKEPIEIQGE